MNPAGMETGFMQRLGRHTLAGVCLLVLLGTRGIAETPSREEVEFFESKVRPILVENCYECHSVEAEDIEAGLVLDSKWGWETGGDSGPAVIPGDPDKSLLIEAVRYGEDIVSGMPPRSKLPPKQIAILEQWVKMGAPDPRPKASRGDGATVEEFDLWKRYDQHWSWRPIADPSPPQVADESWPNSPIDRFVLAKIEEAELRPALDADRRIWIRRVYFDLIGLPPTPGQVAKFLADESDQAYERVVTELLDSHHFGEKWARHWMDLVRYAETYGHEFDYPLNHAHEYRDYLIRAINADVPYDQFIREHLAGDLMPQPRRHPTEDFNESIIGTGFWYFHEATHAPTDVLGNEADIVDNQIDVFGKAFLGLTVACARCHDHKFDAISTADYYALSAYIQSSCRQEALLDPKQQGRNTTDAVNELRGAAAKRLQSIDRGIESRFRPGSYFDAAKSILRRRSTDKKGADIPPQWIDEVAQSRGLEPKRLKRWIDRFDHIPGASNPSWKDSEDVVLEDFDSGNLPPGWSTSGIAFAPVGDKLTLAVDGTMANPGTVDSSLSGVKQSGILRSPTFEITSPQIHVRMKASANATVRVIIDNYQMAHFNALLFRGTFLNAKGTDTGGKWEWKSLSGDLRKYVGHKAYLEFVDNGDATIAIDEIRFSSGPPPSAAVERKPHASLVNHRWREGLRNLRQGRSNRLIAWMLREGLITLGELSPESAELLEQARTVSKQIPAPRFAVAMAEGTTEDAHVYIRGSHQNLGQVVPPRFLEALGGERESRLELADRVASVDNPLTARVIVNRLWHHVFGRGIVPTVDDFGPQGQPPSHPELLDWLAQDLMRNGWSMKHSIRQIVLSRTYRQDSRAHQELDEEKIAVTDPMNVLVHRMSVRRLPSESIRDAILMVSGRLDPQLYGPSVPTHRTPFMTGRGARPSGPLDGNGRRSIYLSIYRNFLNPFLMNFDMPSPFGPKGRRSQSNVPAQALTLMNDPLVVQQSKVWADRILSESNWSDADRIAAMVEQSHGVLPGPEQTELLQQFLAQQAELHGTMDRRAWADLGHALLNMKAFYFLR